MPLVVMCGIANSGKSVRAEEIQRYLQEKHPNLPPPLLISEETLNFIRAVDYKGNCSTFQFFYSKIGIKMV